MKRCTTPTMRYSRLILLLITLLLAPRCASPTPPPITPDIVAEYLQAAAGHIAAGEYTAAETAYRKAIQATPNDPQPALELAHLYMTWQRPREGLSALYTARRCGASSQETAVLRLELLALAGNWSQVATEATERLRAYPSDGKALKLLTEAYMQDYQCSAATTIAQRWHETAPDDRDATFIWGVLSSNFSLLCETDTRLGETAVCAQTGEGSNPDTELATALIRNGNWPLAACVLTRAAAHSTATAETRAWLGEALTQVGRPGEAEKHLISATTLAPEMPLGWLLLGTYYLGQQKTDAARESLLNVLTLDPHNPALYLALAEATAQAGHYDEVEAWIAAALDNAPADADVAKAAARFYLERYLIHATYPLHAIESAIQLAPDDGEAQMLLGQFRLIAGDNAGALDALNAAIELDSTLGEAHYLRGRALQAAGEQAEAQEAFVRAADLGYWP